MNTRDEMTGESAADSTWFGLDRLRLNDESGSVIVTVGSPSRWDRTHLRRLRQSADLPGLVPIIDADTSSDGKAYAVTPAVDAPTLSDLLESGDTSWQSRAGITEATARAAHEAHMRGLFHGALDPSQIRVLDNDVAVEGIGLGLGGDPDADQEQWAAPEVRNQGEVTERSDVYSLGKVLEASLGDSADEAPRSVRRLIMWSTSDTPEARPPSALEFASILAEAMGEDRETYNPAFIPTSDLGDLASTAPQAVAAHTPSDPSSRGVGGAAVAGAAVAGAAAVGAASLLGDDEEEVGDAVEVVDEPDVEEAEASVDEPEVESEPDPEPEPDELLDEAVETSDIDAGVGAAVGTATTEISEADLAAAAEDDIDGVDTSDFEVPAAARTIDIPDSSEERRGNRAGILVGAILAAGLGLVAFQLLNSDDDDPGSTEAADTAEDDGDSAVTDGDDDASAEEGDDSSATAGDGEDDDDATTDGDDAMAEEGDDSSATAGDDSSAAEGEGDDDATGAEGDDDATGAEGEGDDATSGTEGDDSSAAEGEGDDDATGSEGDDSSAAEGEGDDDATAGTDGEGDDDATTDETDDSTSSSTDGEGDDDGATSETDEDGTAAESDSSDDGSAAVAGPAIVSGAISADDAGVQLLHGIPGVDVDVYLNGEALAPGFAPNTVAGPADLPPGTYDVSVYPASDNPPAVAADRTDDPVIAETVTVGSEPVTLAAHLDAAGVPTLSRFEEDLSTLAPGKSRIEVRHLAAAPAVEVTVDGGSAAPVESGRAQSFVLDAGSHVLEATTADGTPVKTATVVVDDGELAAVSLIGSADGGIEIAVQRYTGLSSAPGGVPTGDSNLLGQADDQTGLFILGGLAALMAAAGALIMTRRSRRVL